MRYFLVISCIALMLLVSSCQKENKPNLSHIPYEPESYTLELPAEFPKLDSPKNNPLTKDGVQLGRRLFYDPILSGDGTQSCSSCHKREHGFSDLTATSVGIDGMAGKRSAMSLLNVGFFLNGLNWDGNVMTLEKQANIPITAPLELHANWDNVEEKLRNHADYPTRFRKAFGIQDKKEITRDLVVKALSQFQRIIVSGGNSKFDKVRRGEAFFTDDEYNGNDMYFDISPEMPDAECGHCHTGALITTNEYVNNGLDLANDLNDFKDKGRGEVTGYKFDNGKFRIPSLRNIALTAPYMHDGRFDTLEEVIDHYNSGGHYAENLDPLIQPLSLTDIQKQQILAFLHTLTDTTYLSNPDLTNPFE